MHLSRYRARRPSAVLRRIAVGIVTAALLLGSGVATAADSEFTPNPDPHAPPSSRPAAGPESLTQAGNRPVSGKNPSAGPTFKQDASKVWQVDRTMAVLRNTVTDADGTRQT